MRIEACFDSHVHWRATGEFSGRLRLDHLKSPDDVLAVVASASHYRGDWLLGFGWDDNKWGTSPSLALLDRLSPERPVAFSRCDAHALWVNSLALKRAGLDPAAFPTGVLVDNEMAPVEKQVPELNQFEVRRQLLKGVQIFNEAGITHIRDMTCDETQWNEAVKLDESGLLTLAVEEYFWLKDESALGEILQLAVIARAGVTRNLRVMGLKLFFDGALGSEGAWLSRHYCGSQHQGHPLWSADALREAAIKSWELGLDLAVHAIGDEAADTLVNLMIGLKSNGHMGRLHLEHAEILRPETVAKMKNLNIECHLQPCHWLSDRVWLSEKIGDLARFAFPWRSLQENEIPFDFGSDSPIESPELARTLLALQESAEQGIPRLLGEPTTYMSHRDLAWAPNTFTQLTDGRPTQVVYRGEDLI